jgi:predicted dehydrogenase
VSDYSIWALEYGFVDPFPASNLFAAQPNEDHRRMPYCFALVRSARRCILVDTGFAGGATGELRASMWSADLLRIRARAIGEHGTLVVTNFVAPRLWSRFTVTMDGQRRRERFGGEATYVHQLRAFAAAVRGEPANLTPPADSVATMSVIDDIYAAAGLPLRG